jgi:hypothetical protein
VTRAAFVALLVLTTTSASAQTIGPYVTGGIGLSGGDGGAAPSAGGSVGYMTPRRLAFELEINVSPGLDFGDLGLTRDRPIGLIFPFPQPTLDATGRLLTFQTNIVAALNTDGRLRVFAAGGGGVAQLHQDILYRYPNLVFPADFTSIGPILPPLQFEIVEQRTSRSESALCLNAGGIVEYALGSRFALATDARYMHAFFNQEGMHTARITVRGRWRF